MPSVTQCDERAILHSRFRADLRVYIDATMALDNSSVGGSFEHAYEYAMRAREAFEQARKALNDHMAQHGCENALVASGAAE
jgi:hypothetical protein